MVCRSVDGTLDNAWSGSAGEALSCEADSEFGLFPFPRVNLSRGPSGEDSCIVGCASSYRFPLAPFHRGAPKNPATSLVLPTMYCMYSGFRNPSAVAEHDDVWMDCVRGVAYHLNSMSTVFEGGAVTAPIAPPTVRHICATRMSASASAIAVASSASNA